ncbi:MAG: hypothetical protein ACPIOQ_14175 [Promethearchaeia archaeon]
MEGSGLMHEATCSGAAPPQTRCSQGISPGAAPTQQGPGLDGNRPVFAEERVRLRSKMSGALPLQAQRAYPDCLPTSAAFQGLPNSPAAAATPPGRHGLCMLSRDTIVASQTIQDLPSADRKFGCYIRSRAIEVTHSAAARTPNSNQNPNREALCLSSAHEQPQCGMKTLAPGPDVCAPSRFSDYSTYRYTTNRDSEAPLRIAHLQIDASEGSQEGSEVSEQTISSAASGASTLHTGVSGTESVAGDVGIAVVLEVSRPQGALLRVSDVEADSTAETSGQVRKGDLVLAINGCSLAGAEANTNRFKGLSEGNVGTCASFRLMDPVTSEVRTVNLMRALKAPQTHRCLRRLRRLQRALGGDDRESAERLAHYLKGFIEGPQELSLRHDSAAPNLVLLGRRGVGKTSLLRQIVGCVNGGTDHLPSKSKDPTAGRGSMTHRVSKIIMPGGSSARMGKVVQPCEITDTIPLDAFGGKASDIAPFLRWVLTGRLVAGVTTADVSAHSGVILYESYACWATLRCH